MRLLIYTEAGTFGLGHAIRCIHLARALTSAGVAVEFTTPINEPIGAERLQQEGHVVHHAFMPADAVLIDVEQYPGLEFMQMLREQYRHVILIGGVSYPPANELESLVDLTIYQGELFDHPTTERALNGPEYLIIDPVFSQCVPNRRGHILVSMGGRDPEEFSKQAVNIVSKFDKKIIAIRGPAFRLKSTVSIVENIELVDSPLSLVPYINGASLAIVTTGMTAYECLAAGVPCVLFNISADHERTAAALQERGCAVNMGIGFDPYRLKAGVNSASALFELMSRSARALVDGKGAGRVTGKITEII